MSCHDLPEDKKVMALENKILLMGPPNVGKSVFFTEFTKVHVISSNYTGTTVSYMQGKMDIDGKAYTLIDVPGTYALSATSEAEGVAVQFLQSDPRAILFVLNAADLEGSIKLLLEVLEYKIPVVAALNLTDVAERKGMNINLNLLQKELGVPVISTVAVKNEGLEEVKANLALALAKGEVAEASPCDSCGKAVGPSTGLEHWERAREIVARSVKQEASKESKLDKLGDMLLKPWPGIPIAILIIILSLGVVVGAGKALRAVLLLPLVNQAIVPFFEFVISQFDLNETLRNILIGDYGIFRISFEWILALVLPYVILFQFVFSFLEDSGILPRLAVLFDNIMSKLGVQGGSLINIMLGFGCAVPAIIGTRVATTRKERLVVTAVVCFAVPCISQTGALVSLLSEHSILMLLAVMFTGAVAFILTAAISSKLIKGNVDPLIIEVPNLLIPNRKAYFKKLWVRIKQFLVEAEGPMLVAIFFAAILAETGMLNGISELLKPIVSGWLGLPPEASLSLILGIIRREMSVAPLLAMNLTALQMYVGAVVSLLYLPCMSVFAILAKEFNFKVALAIFAGTTFTAIFVGGLLNHSIGFLMTLFA